MATINMLEETANYLLNHCFVLGSVEDQRAKYLYVQDHLPEVRAVFAPLGYAVTLYPAPLQAAALVNEHEGSQARLLKYESILLLVLRLLYLQKRESLAASADQVLVTVEEVQTELQKMNLPRRLDQRTLEELMRTLRRYNLARPVGRLTGLDSRIEVFPTVLLALPDADLADAAAGHHGGFPGQQAVMEFEARVTQNRSFLHLLHEQLHFRRHGADDTDDPHISAPFIHSV